MFVEHLTLTPEIESLLNEAVGFGGLSRYEVEPRPQLCGWLIEGRLVSAAGFLSDPSGVLLIHLATAAEDRGSGYGGQLVREIAARFAPRPVVAETDDDAVGFYRRLGFVVEETRSEWGTARYRCALPGEPRAGAAPAVLDGST